MRFYDRDKEIGLLRDNWTKSSSKSLFTVLIGRRRIGKTALLLKTEQEQKIQRHETDGAFDGGYVIGRFALSCRFLYFYLSLFCSKWKIL